ncbi:MAG: NlpC/P60 family protein [Bacteroidia bacterium]|nr:NlpC/P60 family protein [Bacteroidia bacterium]
MGKSIGYCILVEMASPMLYFASEAVIPVRSSPQESAEMETQLIFGETCECLEKIPSWWKIRVSDDGYEGWINPRMLLELSEKIYPQNHNEHFVIRGSLKMPDGTDMRLPLGARIPETRDRLLRINGHTWAYNPDLVLIPMQNAWQRITVARLFMNSPYLWGGRSGYGIDCSGLVQQVFKICGVQLPRNASQQAETGKLVSFEERKSGDLAFFSKPNQNKITHVGILSNEDSVIHASGKVREDIFDKQGIVHRDNGEVTHQLVIIRRW